MKKNILVAHGGGPTPVMNSSLQGVIEGARSASNGGKLFAARKGKIRTCAAGTSADAPADLVELGKSQFIGIFNNQRVAVGHIHTRFDNRGADENVNFALQQPPPNVAEFLLPHFAVCHGDARLGEQFGNLCRTLVNGFDAVVQKIYLPAAAQFLFHCLQQHTHIIFQNIGLHGVAVLRGFFNHRHIANARHRHIERARNGCRGKRQHVDCREPFFEFFFLRHAEPLFFIDNQQSQILKLHIFGNKTVCADENVDIPTAQIL